MSRPQTQKLPVVEVCDRLFTVAQANRSLVLVRRIVGDALEYYEQVLDQQEMLDRAQRRGDEVRAGSCQELLYRLMEKIQLCADELGELGLEFKDWATGTVDYPGLLDGREVNLCWQYGEQSVRYWHEPFDLCETRRPIQQALPQT